MLQRLLITGANGRLGGICRQRLQHLAKTIRLTDRDGLSAAGPNEEIVHCDLTDKAAVERLVDGCDGVIHLAGQSVEASWEVIRPSNIDAMFCLYEAARKSSSTPRIAFASSNHATGFHPQTARLDADSPTRPDGLYGVSKVFGEALARMYYDKFGIETASIRIGWCFPEATNHRALCSWLSYNDLMALFERIFAVPRLGCPIIYGASDNPASWWDNSKVAYLGWHPKDCAETFRAKVEAEVEQPASDDPSAVFQGGAFCAEGIHET